MKDVFILGAGFSAAVTKNQMPTMTKLMNLVREKYKKKFPGQKSYVVDNYEDFEFLLSTLFIRQPYGGEPNYYQGLATYHKITEVLVEILDNLQSQYYLLLEDFFNDSGSNNQLNFKTAQANGQLGESWLSNFWREYNQKAQFTNNNSWVSPLGCHWLSDLIGKIFDQENVTVLTFNYDTLIEIEWCFQLIHYLNFSLSKVHLDSGAKCKLIDGCLNSLVNFNTQTAALSLYPQKIPLSDYRFGQSFDVGSITPHRFDEKTFKLLKLHGSINLCWDEDLASPVYLRDKSSNDLNRFIIPPVLDKTNRLNHPYLKLNWSLARKSLEDADRIFILGYSLPLTDFSTRSVLFQSQLEERSQKLEVYPINNDERILSRMEEVFSKSTIKPEFLGPDSISRFVGWYMKG